MAETKRSKTQDIPFVLDDSMRIVKAVTKHTTCADVIAKLPNLHVPLAVFLCVDGVQKQLPGKSRLLKVWRANASSKNVAFVIRKSVIVKEKAKRGTRKVFGDKRKCDKPQSESHMSDRLSRESMKRVSDLAFFARYQKKRLQVVGNPSMNEAREAEHSERNKLMRRLTAQSSTSSMDAFLARANLDEMAGFLTFCGHVTTEALQKGTSLSNKQSVHEVTLPVNKTKRDVREGLTSMKLSLKRKFGATNKLTVRSTSTGTIESTDTGYHSIDSVGDGSYLRDTEADMAATKLHKRHTRLLDDTDDGPRHSTPVAAYRQQKHRPDNMECTLTQEYLETFNEGQGKSLIMEKFMASNKIADGQTFNELLSKRQSIERQSMPAFHDQKDRCRFLWDQFCDSDSESEASNCSFDNVIVDTTSAEMFTQRTLRRESAFTDLRKCTVSNRFSLPANIINTQRDAKETDFDYSFNCSFPRMDNDYHSMDFSCSFDESDGSDYVMDRMLDDKEPVSDESLDSFMRTRSFLEDCDGDITCDENPLDMNIGCSDEDLVSFYI